MGERKQPVQGPAGFEPPPRIGHLRPGRGNRGTLENTLQLLFALAMMALLVGAVRSVLRLIRHEFVVFEGEHALLFHRGKWVRALAPGAWVFWGRHFDLRRTPATKRLHAVANQEVPTSDGMPVRLSVFVGFRVAKPETALLEHESWEMAMHAAIQVALRTVVHASTADELMGSRDALGPRIAEQLAHRFSTLGLELDEGVDVRDLTFPGDLKRAFAKVLLARKEGEAALERARGEQAALRSLANAARLVEEHPGLLQLRALQAAEQGATVVFGDLPRSTGVG